MTLITLFASMLLAIGSLYWGYDQAGFEMTSRWILIVGVIWLFAQWRRWYWFSSLVLFIFVSFSAFGLVMGFPFHWMLAASLFALFAWDMTDFRRRLHFAAADDDLYGIERRHIARLTLLLLAALALVTISLFVQVKFTFEWGVILVIVAVFGLTQLINWFGRQNK